MNIMFTVLPAPIVCWEHLELTVEATGHLLWFISDDELIPRLLSGPGAAILLSPPVDFTHYTWETVVSFMDKGGKEAIIPEL